MSRILWLAYETPPHPDAVVHPADEEDAELVLELLQATCRERQRIATQLRNFLRKQAEQPYCEREAVPCRRQTGWYQLVPWRLAKWLSRVLIAEQSAIDRTQEQIRSWLASSPEPAIVRPGARNKAS